MPKDVDHDGRITFEEFRACALSPERFDETIDEFAVALAAPLIAPFDPDLALPIPGDIEPILSRRDRDAPTFAEVRAARLLPDYATCQRIEMAE